MIFKDEKDFLERVEDAHNSQNKRERLTELQIRELQRQYPNLPVDFIAYLREIGCGNLRECQFNVTSSLFTLHDVGLSSHYDLQSGIKFFGDNFAGDFAGFDVNSRSGRVVEFWHEDGSLYNTGKSFKEYIREQMLMGGEGNDLRIKR